MAIFSLEKYLNSLASASSVSPDEIKGFVNFIRKEHPDKITPNRGRGGFSVEDIDKLYETFKENGHNPDTPKK